jgi:hypothetical protein
MENLIICLCLFILYLLTMVISLLRELKKKDNIIRLQDNWLKENNIIKKY